MPFSRLFLVLFAMSSLSAPAVRAENTAKLETKPVPDEVSAAVKEALGDQAYQVLEDEKPLFEFWLAKRLPLKESPASPEAGLDTLQTASLVGVVRVHEDRRDYRDDELPKGTYTMRFGKIPSDGNHLGASVYPYFVVLIPAAKDPEVGAITTYKEMTRASSKEAASGHPIILSLRPVKTKPESIPTITEPAEEHQCIVVRAGGQVEGEEKEMELVFEIVFEGIGEI